VGARMKRRGRETPSREKIFVCRPSAAADEQACAEKISPNSPARLSAAGRERGLGALAGALPQGPNAAVSKTACVSPCRRFGLAGIFVPHGIDPPGAPNGSVQRISDIELASRLSFFLWSTIPDEELISLAERGT